MMTRFCFALATLWLGASIVPASAQQPAAALDDRWTAWLGCWQQLEDSVRDDSVPDSLRDRGARPTKGVVVCVTPGGTAAAVTFSTVIEKQAALQETIVADGANHAIDEPGCKGQQRARWSENGRRLFAHAELTCADGSDRTISGLTTIAPGPIWVDIQVVTSEGRESIRVRRYRRAPDHAYVAARVTREQLAAAATAAARQAASFTLEDVKEATAKVTPSTVEAALIETNAGFPLNAKRLQELDAAGVPDRVLDLMIALSFPNRFIVERRTSSSGSSGWDSGSAGTWGWLDPSYDLFPYHYAPFGYGMWGRHDLYYYGAPVYAVDVVSPPPQPSGSGRVVNGLGYTRVRSREPESGQVAGGSNGGGSQSTGGGSGSGGGVSTHGYSGGGGGDSGRTAVSRPPG
jgi:hypothetical protein